MKTSIDHYNHSIHISFLLFIVSLLVACGGDGGSSTSTTSQYTVGGAVSGLTGSVVLQNNSGDDLTISTDGSFIFSASLADASSYSVSVVTQPTGQTCTVSNASGTLSGSNITDVAIDCTAIVVMSYTIGGSVSGLTGSGLVLQNNSGDDLAVTGSNFTFGTALDDGSFYSVSVLTQATGQTCSVTNGSGTLAGANVTDVAVDCVTDSSNTTTNTGLYDIVDTNQTNCYNSSTGAVATCTSSGHDADYNGNQPSYTDNGDGTVTDNVTGLIWLQSTDTDGVTGNDVNDKKSQTDAITYCSNLTTAGHTWRLPNIKELYSLILFHGKDASTYTGSDTSVLTPFIDTTYFDKAFGDTGSGERIIDGQYATTTDYVWTTMNGDATMFGVNFADGRIKGYPKNLGPTAKTFYLRCVTGNTSYGVNDFIDNGDTTITDNATGLMWQQGDTQSTNWENAISTCENATTAGYTDWRLPNVKELQSIVDYTRSPDTTSSAAIDANFLATSFTNEEGVTDWGYYWASTTHAEELSTDTTGENATYLSFGRALGYFDAGGSLSMLDVHGAGAQRSNDKVDLAGGGVSTADLGQGTFYYHGPQGDILRLDNWVRCVRNK